MSIARATGKWVVLLAGRETCNNCQYMKTVVAESVAPPVKTLLTNHFVLWYSPIDDSSEYVPYAEGLDATWILPLICVIDPWQAGNYLDRSVGIQMAPTFYQRLLKHAHTVDLLPRITDFEPRQGVIGTSVRIQGKNLTNVLEIQFNGTSASFSASADDWEAVVPIGATTGPITVVLASGQAMSVDTFAVIETLPLLSIRRTADALGLEIAWTHGDSRWRLQSITQAPNEQSPGWMDVILPDSAIVARTWVITNAPAVDTRYYRLHLTSTTNPP
jgi:hypothetical protein